MATSLDTFSVVRDNARVTKERKCCLERCCIGDYRSYRLFDRDGKIRSLMKKPDLPTMKQIA